MLYELNVCVCVSHSLSVTWCVFSIWTPFFHSSLSHFSSHLFLLTVSHAIMSLIFPSCSQDCPAGYCNVSEPFNNIWVRLTVPVWSLVRHDGSWTQVSPIHILSQPLHFNPPFLPSLHLSKSSMIYIDLAVCLCLVWSSFPDFLYPVFHSQMSGLPSHHLLLFSLGSK